MGIPDVSVQSRGGDEVNTFTSFGAGVQTTVMLIMMAQGKIDKNENK